MTGKEWHVTVKDAGRAASRADGPLPPATQLCGRTRLS